MTVVVSQKEEFIYNNFLYKTAFFFLYMTGATTEKVLPDGTWNMLFLPNLLRQINVSILNGGIYYIL